MVERSAARIDLGAIRHNVEVLARAAGRAEVVAVVKANAYGHGAAPVARAALEGGASRLGLAALAEVEELRAAGVDAPLVLWGPLLGDEWRRAAATGCEIAVWTPEGAVAAAAAGIVRIHLKLDSGMGRLGARPDAVAALAEAAADPRLDVVGLMTHFATADETSGENAGFMVEQLVRFRAMTGSAPGSLPARHPPRGELRGDASLGRHALRPGALRHRDLWLRPVRRSTPPPTACDRPCRSTRTSSSVKPILGTGERRLRAPLARRPRKLDRRPCPFGYADGYPRAYANAPEVLVGGRRVPVVGMVSMDQITVDLGPEADRRGRRRGRAARQARATSA